MFVRPGNVITVTFRKRHAREAPPRVILWPSAGTTVIRFSLGKLKEISSFNKQRRYTIDIMAENLWGKAIHKADFSLYLFDKNKIRIGDGWISLSDVAPGGILKFQIAAEASGIPVTTLLSPRTLPAELQSYLAPPQTVATTINSVPQGATVKIDGVEVGVTPKVVRVIPGKHMLEFSKSGFNSGRFPLEITSDDASGGSVSYELGTSAHDTVELRDGSVLSGDLESVSGTEVFVKAGGTVQRFDRNQVKRIALVTRASMPQ